MLVLHPEFVRYLIPMPDFWNGAIAQLGERLHGMQEVSGSIPLGSTTSSMQAIPPVSVRGTASLLNRNKTWESTRGVISRLMRGFMIRQFAFALLLAVASPVLALASDVPSDEAAFTTFIRDKLQLYSLSPIRVAGPLSLSMQTADSSIDLPSLRPLHELCQSSPTKCDQAVNDYIQTTSRDILQKPTTASSTSNRTQLVVCNRTTRTVQFASVYIPVAETQWRSTGWMSLDPGMCRGILQTTHPVFYARAEDAVRNAMHNPYRTGGMTEGDVTIANAGGDMTLCAPHVGNWDDHDDSLDGLCKSNREPTSFRTFHNDGKPLQIWNLEQ